MKQRELKVYFAQDIPEEQKRQAESKLEAIVERESSKDDKQLHGVVRKVVSWGTMGVAFANEIYAYVSPSVPLRYIAYGNLAMFGIKSLAELPALFMYVLRSKDGYGALKLLLMRLVNYLLPVVGPLLEAGAFERMARRRIIKQAKYEFIKQFGSTIVAGPDRSARVG